MFASITVSGLIQIQNVFSIVVLYKGMEGVHDMYMALSGGNMCEEVHPCRVNSSIQIAVSADMDYWNAYMVHRQLEMDTLKCAR